MRSHSNSGIRCPGHRVSINQSINQSKYLFLQILSKFTRGSQPCIYNVYDWHPFENLEKMLQTIFLKNITTQTPLLPPPPNTACSARQVSQPKFTSCPVAFCIISDSWISLKIRSNTINETWGLLGLKVWLKLWYNPYQ